MRITVKTMQDRNTKESRYMKKFQKKLKKLLLKTFGMRESYKETINQTIDNFDTFDPVLDWYYKPLCGCEVSGFDAINHNTRQNRLYERNAHLLYYTRSSCAALTSEIVEGYEMWLLEDMNIVFTYFVQMKVKTADGNERLTYRYPLGKKMPEDMEVSLYGLLRTIEEDVSDARDHLYEICHNSF